MKNEIISVLLIAVMVVFCCGCASEITKEESLAMNEESLVTEEKGLTTEVNESYDGYSGRWTTEGVSYHDILLDGGTVFSVTISGTDLQGSICSVQWMTERIAEIDDIAGVIEDGVCRYEFEDDGQGDSGTLYIKFLEDRIEIEVEDFKLADSNLSGFAISGIYTLYRAAENDPEEVISETDVPEVTVPGAVVPETSVPEAGVSDGTTADWSEVYYERYYEIWDSEEAMLAEIKARSSYRDNCSFFGDAVYYIEGGGGEYMMKADISYLVEPLYPTDLVYIEEEDFKDYPPLLLHILKNEIYARHGYIFRNEDLNNYFRGMIWYTPQYESAEFDASVFNEIEVYNLDILARLDTYNQN